MDTQIELRFTIEPETPDAPDVIASHFRTVMDEAIEDSGLRTSLAAPPDVSSPQNLPLTPDQQAALFVAGFQLLVQIGPTLLDGAKTLVGAVLRRLPDVGNPTGVSGSIESDDRRVDFVNVPPDAAEELVAGAVRAVSRPTPGRDG